MASLALGLVGGYFFGPIGFMVGSLIGNLLTPQGKTEGPRLKNLKLQDSRYGEMIPICYGTVRSSGQVIWQTDLKEHSHTTGGKGSGPSVTTFSYSASFAVKIAKGPIAELLKIWANGTLIYDVTPTSQTDNSQVPITIYLGVESANPDPTMEAELGVGNVPAFRDDFTVVFTDMDLSNYGNSLPQLSFEFVTKAGSIPWRVSTFEPRPDNTGGIGMYGNVVYDQTTQQVTVGEAWPNPSTPSWKENTFDIYGNLISSTTPVVMSDLSAILTRCLNSMLVFGYFGSSYNQLHQDGLPLKSVSNPVQPSNAAGAITANNFMIQGDFLFGICTGPDSLGAMPAPGGVPSGIYIHTYTLPALGVTSNWRIATSDDQYIYVGFDASTGHSQLLRFTFDAGSGFTLDHTWGDGQMPSDWLAQYPFFIFNGYLVSNTFGTPGPFYFCTVYKFDAGFTWSLVGRIRQAQGGCVYMGNGLLMGTDGVISLIPPPEDTTLAEIVSDLSVRAGLSTGDIDVTQLTPIVPGYMVTTQAECRADINPLRTAYFFDAVESSGVIKFIMRGSDSVVSIPDNDLAAQQAHETPPPLMKVDRQQLIELPTQVNVGYMDLNAAYQKGNQEARRMVTDAFTDSGGPSSVELAIALDATKARQIANVLLYGTWIERNALSFRTSRQYDYLEPTDVITAHGYTLRITRKTQQVAGVIEFEGVETVPMIYVTVQSSVNTMGGQSPVTPAFQLAQLLLLDLPLLNDTDASNGFYAAMAGAVNDTWPGGTLFESTDSGSTYKAISATPVAQAIGKATSTLGDWPGANMMDEVNAVTVEIGVGGGTLSSVTNDQILNGANEGVLGVELLQWRDANLTGPSTYKLTGLLRGRRGTEWAMGTHIANERFVAFSPQLMNPAGPFSEIGQTENFKGVTFGGVLTSATAQQFINTANALKCYSPVQLGGGVDGSGNVTLTWVRRTRIGGAWLNGIDVPLSETTESYVVQIWDSSYTQCARIITVNALQSTVYTSAQQVTDFGAQQQTIYFTVGQLGTVGLGSQAQGTAPGAGGSNGLPLAPITPYNSNPIINPPPPSGGGCLPVFHDFGSTGGVNIATLTVGSRYVFKFTTPAGAYSQASLSAAEYGGNPVIRFLRVTSDCAGLNTLLTAGGTQAAINWSSLAHNTTYYCIQDFQFPDGSYSASVGFQTRTITEFVT